MNINRIIMYSVLLLSGGKGSRMQESTPKQYLLLAGKPMIMHSLERIDQLDDVNEIIIVCDPSFIDSIKQMLHEYNITKNVVFVKGGETRQESVYNGLKAIQNGNVIIHEAARPFVKQNEFKSLIDYPEPNVIYGNDIPFTVLTGNTHVHGVLNRSELINVQLPQKFNANLLRQAHEIALERGDVYTEDSSLLYDVLKEEIRVIKGTDYNIKITNPIDLLTGEIIYRNYISNRK